VNALPRAPEHLPSLNQGWRQFRRGNLVSAWKFSFGVETSKIEEFLRKTRKIKETWALPAGMGSQGVLAWSRAACGVSAWSGRAGLEMWVVLPWALQLGRRGRATNLGEAVPTWRGSDICALCFSQQQKIETPNLWNLRSSIKYLATALPLFRYWMNGVLHTFPICWGLHTTGLGLCWQGSASRGRSKA